ncbi:MAG: winged helix-turn-helix transcriptional regulator [Candidatus Delongbacteria bacterium]|nr:winged helix-turn-helix transcriptional regulator [Candidatus Delongbacteria bacterium]MCG2760197.1 winged helix-turn-helix transcriptional regulator [Candidatus Delongbacteria bacterium]
MTENQNREYKQSWHDDYLKWVCGFANAVGVSDYSCKDVGLPDPVFLEKNGGMQVVLYKDVTPQVSDPVTATTDPVNRPSQPTQSTDQITGKLQDKLNRSQMAIIEQITKNGNITSCELSEIIGISDRQIKSNIKFLVRKGIIERIGSRKTGYWAIKA